LKLGNIRCYRIQLFNGEGDEKPEQITKRRKKQYVPPSPSGIQLTMRYSKVI